LKTLLKAPQRLLPSSLRHSLVKTAADKRAFECRIDVAAAASNGPMSLFEKITAAFRSQSRPAAGSEPGRNEPCWCGSGQKYKRCHLEADRLKAQTQRTNCRAAT
jgi:hypothetical protein